ncbi:MAG: alpha/beta fold hydrolase [Rhodospirillales bacterium]|nr:alpha/beta fold hydrolase [Rhodospirillales bacterium]MDE2319652.1 alpha/beta fold hydrolase [Rhodospirillales bacterium]
MILNVLDAGEGSPLVLLHGLFGAARNLGILSRALSSSFRVFALDQRNHGESPRGAVMDYAVMAADVVETLAYLGISRARICGHSMGGKTAMMLALTKPELVEKLAVMDIAPVTYRHDHSDLVAAMRAVPLSATLTRGEADKAMAATVKEAPLRAFLLNNLVLGEAPHWRLGLDEISANMANLFRWDDPPGAVPYTGPALFLCGAKSNFVTPAAEPDILQRFPQARIERVEGASHWLHAEKPEQVIAALRDFLI